MDRDSRGYAISLDLLLALIPLTLVLGLVAADMDNFMYEMQDVIYRGSTERVAADTMNTLLTTSGDPYNWENNVSNLKVPGLAKYDTLSQQPDRYYLKPQKIGSITSQQIQNVVGDQYGYSMNISSISTGTNVLMRGTRNDSSVDPAAKDVVRVERVVLYSAFDIVSQAVNIRGTGTPLIITANSFPTNKQYNEVFDYYVYVNSTGVTSVTAATVDINSVTVVKSNDFGGGGHPVNPVIKLIDPDEYGSDVLKNETDFLDNVVTIRLEGSPTDRMNVYILQVPKGTPESEISLKGAELSKFRAILYVWVK
ncbi:hypothetical protein [Methanobacterium petrolearium]|nr:hypothetical protein [Methanobacterium petrolearium]MBP1945245.1 hypothetical protein [Methanobacterium petrolearium]BDZ71184.1 hypothetical protein GCM10025861_17010 [Methanobacterium petrolearium]